MRKFKTFNSPYILIEDTTGKHQPFFKEYNDTKTPYMYLTGEPLGCPFLKNYNAKKKNTNKKNQKKQGYCELCYVKFPDYEAHIKEDEHCKYALNDDNFREIDDLICEFNEGMLSSDNYETPEMISSPSNGKRPDYFKDPSAFLSYLSPKQESGMSVYILSDPEQSKKARYAFDNVDDLIDGVANNLDLSL